jgi:hypothetical protein
MTAKRWKRTAGSVALMICAPGLMCWPALASELEPGADRSFDPVRRNISDPPALTPRRDPTPPAPRPGPDPLPDPSRKTFVVPPSMRGQATFSLPDPGTSAVPLFEAWSSAERFNFLSGYPVTVPSGRSRPAGTVPEPTSPSAEEGYATRLRQRVSPAPRATEGLPVDVPGSGSAAPD